MGLTVSVCKVDMDELVEVSQMYIVVLCTKCVHVHRLVEVLSVDCAFEPDLTVASVRSQMMASPHVDSQHSERNRMLSKLPLFQGSAWSDPNPHPHERQE